eukprot:5182379-Prymnesium_polylepis.1
MSLPTVAHASVALSNKRTPLFQRRLISAAGRVHRLACPAGARGGGGRQAAPRRRAPRASGPAAHQRRGGERTNAHAHPPPRPRSQ